MYDEKEMNAYKSMISQMLHGEETKDKIYGMLQSGDPSKTVPAAALAVSSQATDAFKQKKGKAPALETLIGGAVVLGTELIEIGNTGGFFQVDESTAMPLVEAASKAIILDGIKKDYIDPVELQELTNGGLSESHSKEGLSMAEERGIPKEAGESVAMEQYASRREKGALAKSQQATTPQQQPVSGGMNQ